VVVKKTVVSVSVRVTAVGVTPTGRVAVAVDGKTTFYTLSASHASVKLPTFTKTGSHKVTVTYIGSSTLVKSTKSFSVSVRSR
jgi:5'-nucleotidase